VTTGHLQAISTPPGWRWRRLDRVSTRRQETGAPELQPLSVFLNAGVVPRSEREDNYNRLGDDLSKYLVVRSGDVVFNKLRTWQGGFGLSRYVGIVSPAYFVISPSEQLVPSFLHHLLLSLPYLAELKRRSKWMPPSQFDISWDDLRTLPVLLPPELKQRAIASFLDRKTAAIDFLIAKKERLIELLQEKRRALITQVVTTGLDPRVPMKDSGIDWLGKIPTHWDVLPLKRRWVIHDCKHRTVPFLEEGIPLASIGEVQGLDVDLSEAKRTTRAEFFRLIEGGRRPRVGDIIYSRNATVGEAAFVATSDEFCMGQDVCLIRSDRQNQRFLVFQLRCPAVMAQVDALMVGATFKRINISQIAELLICVPPTDEQDRIATFCDSVHSLSRRATDSLSNQIRAIQEYRQGLISAAVTGKIEIPLGEVA
jgi:type I restriction enzyme S subunit